jgi:hypothetical protein
MSISPFLIAALLVFVGWLWWVRRRAETRRAVIRKPDAAALSLRGHTTRAGGLPGRQESCRPTLPGAAAPPLPLDNCAVASCRCRYDHFADRREDERRHSNALLRGLTPHTGNTDHRSGRDRRRSAAAGADARH